MLFIQLFSAFYLQSFVKNQSATSVPPDPSDVRTNTDLIAERKPGNACYALPGCIILFSVFTADHSWKRYLTASFTSAKNSLV